MTIRVILFTDRQTDRQTDGGQNSVCRHYRRIHYKL